MTVIKFLGAKNEEKAQDYLFEKGRNTISVRAKEGTIYDVDPINLKFLDDLNLKYRQFKEDELPDILDENGLATLSLLRRSLEEYHAPIGYLSLHIDVNEEHVLDAKRIIDKYKPIKFIARDCSVIKVGDSGTQKREGIAIITAVPKKYLEALVNNLTGSGIAGYDENHKIYVSGFNR